MSQSVSDRIAPLINSLVSFRDICPTGKSVSGLLAMLMAYSGRPCMGEVARRIGLTTASLTGTMDGLEDAGMAVRVMSVVDRRSYFVELTPEGREFITSFLSAYQNENTEPNTHPEPNGQLPA